MGRDLTDGLQDTLENLGIRCLYHVTDKDNLPSILKERGLSSWRQLTEAGIRVPRPGGDAVSHRLDARFGGRDGAVHLFASEPTEGVLRSMRDTHRYSELCVLTVSLRALRPETTVFWIGDPYDGGERIDRIGDLAARIEKDPSILSRVSVDIMGGIHVNHIGNIPLDVWTRISEVHPTAIVFVVDQSCSMARGTDLDNVDYDYISDLAALSVNNQIDSFLKRCITEDGVVNHLYDIAVIGYGNGVSMAWNGTLADKAFHSPLELLSHVKEPSDQFRWVDAKDSETRGRCDLAFEYVYRLLSEWTEREENRFSYPPTVIHISDGDVKREYQRDFLLSAEKLKALHTETGHVIVWNIGYFPVRLNEHVFLSGEELPALTQFPGGLVLYEASSYLPDQFKRKASAFHHQDPNLARKTMGVNVKMRTLFDVLQLCVLPEQGL